jgi:hypothetical protein
MKKPENQPGAQAAVMAGYGARTGRVTATDEQKNLLRQP